MNARGKSFWQRIREAARRNCSNQPPTLRTTAKRAPDASPPARSQQAAVTHETGDDTLTTRPRGRTRREALRTLGLLSAVGTTSALTRESALGDEKPNSKKKVDMDALTRPTFIHRDDQHEYERLRKLDLDSPEVIKRRRRMPTGKIGNLEIGRLICGSNMISPNMHARDLIYVNALSSRYNSEERIFMTLKKCEEMGVNAAVLKDHNFRHFRLADYWKHWGGQMLWIADVITKDIKQYERRLVQHLELGAAAAYLWGGATDIWYFQNERDHIIRAFEIMKKYDVPVGIGAHRLEPIMFCEREGLKPDFYILTLHHDHYWSAHPKENRESLEMYEPMSSDHDRYHDNLFCDDAERRIAFMEQVKVPWIAFKVLAAGAIEPEDGFSYAFRGGADFICVGMFDFQVQEDAELVIKTVSAAESRKRYWA